MKKSIFLVALVALFLGLATPDMAIAKSKKSKGCCETTAKCSDKEKEKCAADAKECKTTKSGKDCCAPKAKKEVKETKDTKETKDAKATAK